jgi:hypothetical protein
LKELRKWTRPFLPALQDPPAGKRLDRLQRRSLRQSENFFYRAI